MADRPLPGSRPVAEKKPSAPKPVQAAPRKAVPKQKRSLGDYLLTGSGVALGLACALFPWYVFINQDEFGTPSFDFGKVDAAIEPAGDFPAARPLFPDDIEQRDAADAPALDPMPVGTTAPAPAPAEAAPKVEAQPFPKREIVLNLLHVANGRAMIDDGAGVWIVQRGSVLPDDSLVKAIEQRDGEWVVVTSENKVLRVGK
jgi:hypothetical protein